MARDPLVEVIRWCYAKRRGHGYFDEKDLYNAEILAALIWGLVSGAIVCAVLYG